ncbi:MAG: hypothetical protein ACKOCX_09195 [Planctomycetota bacterium]
MHLATRHILAACGTGFPPPAGRGLIAALVVLVAPAFVTAGELPLTVKVTTPRALLRSGPGDDFYPTERLSPQATVEVWAIDESGYCAVRPTAESFSWLRAADVVPEQADARTDREFVGVVVTDGVVARVGSQLNDLRHVSQVALEAGERVRVLERVRVKDGRHAGEWLRIEPPAGEFRWAWSGDLALPEAIAPVVEAEPPAAGLAAAGEALAAIRDAGTAVTQAVAQVDEPPPAAAATAPGTLAESGVVARLLSGWLPRGTNMFDLSAPAAPPVVAGGGAAPVSADELTDIDLALSLAVAGPSEQWNLAPLRERLRLAAARATSDDERTRAMAIDTRLSRFEAIQARQQAIAPPAAADASPLRLGGMWSSLSAVGTRPVRPGVLPGGRPADGRPDWTPPDQMETTGRLATVISRRPDAPRWAVVDSNNDVLAFVTPRPGVSLAPLVGQQVTVRGARGYMPEYQRPYVVAAEALPRLATGPRPATAGDTTQ